MRRKLIAGSGYQIRCYDTLLLNRVDDKDYLYDMPQTLKRKPTPRHDEANQLRGEIARLLHITPDALREWNTRVCPDCRKDTSRVPVCLASGAPHLPPLFYVLAPEQPDGDMPLGVGATSHEALADLLWNIKLAMLLESLATDL